MSLMSDLFGAVDPGEGYGQQALAALSKLNPPTAEDLKVQLDQMVYQGDLTPEMAQAIMQNPTMLQNMDYNQAGKGAQLEALSRLQGISTGGGLTPIDQAQLNDIEGRTGAQARGAREAVMQNARERGVSGGGAELVGQLTADQDAAQNANKAGLDVAAQAQQRALQAIQATGQLGGQVQSQNYGEAANAANAQDAINKFNTQNSQAVQTANVNAANAAKLRNVDTRQALESGNVDIRNTQAKANAAAKQQAYEDAVQKAGGIATQDNSLAAGKREATGRAYDATGQILGTAGKLGEAGIEAKALAAASDERVKKDVHSASDVDLESFMASLDPKRFRYKDPNQPGAEDGDNVGVIAQDVEKTPVGRTMVKNTPDGKMLDMQKGFGVILAALAALHDKIDNGKETEA